ncbi:hypothetical protein LTS18_001496 [Coniosporium uncinatum]|uniref:Uncharacterized protein n=1 Tax=Coniosporium uncinatum TaxID=93489 RepID=A0ACC3CTA0_9PEZI|nr:hypothetical protein LTS18_001496 [Coniosporium uncinatum]
MQPSNKRQPDKAQDIKKLPKLPINAKIIKRPLLRPSVTSANASSLRQKVVYVSTSTPFISAVKRVRKLLDIAEKCAVQSSKAQPQVKEVRREHDGIQAAAEALVEVRSGRQNEEVLIKGTGRAIEKVLNLAVWFQDQADCRVSFVTRSVGAVDDIEEDPVEQEAETVAGAEQEEDAMEQEREGFSETRVRMTSVLQIAVSLK